MKKEYISPQTIAMLLEATPIMAGSGEFTKVDDTDDVNVTPGEGTYDGNEWASRRNREWEDDEDDMY